MKIKKILVYFSFVFLFACSNVEEKVSKTSFKDKTETIKQVVMLKNNTIYILAENYDYEFKEKEAEKLKNIIEIQRKKPQTKELSTEKQYIIKIYLDGKSILGLDDYFIIKKEENTDLNKLDREVMEFKKILKEKEIKFNLTENKKEYIFDIKNISKVEGRIVKLQNRDEILKQASNSSEEKVKVSLIVEHLLSEEEYNSNLREAQIEENKRNIARAIIAPFAAVGYIILSPLILIGHIVNSN